jgi:chloramphenicol-sensitive protein RarD
MRAEKPAGLPHALGAYLIWGLLPLYLHLLHQVPPFEMVGWRVIFTLPFCLILILILRQGAALHAALTNPKTLLALTISALLIGGNWLIYVWAIQRGHVLASSLGYYINPLANVLAGTVFFHERLSRRQWLAVTLAACGVALLLFGALDMLWISLSLALTFCAYGLIRKTTPVAPIPGLTIEALVLLIPALLLVTYHAQGAAGSAMGGDLSTALLIAGAGIITGTPLVLFATAARRMTYSALGFVQFLAPSLVFILGLFVFHEPLRPVQLASFILIWLAIVLFVIDLFSRRAKV